MRDHTTLRLGPRNARRRVNFGHGAGGLDKKQAGFREMVEHWSTDPRLRHVEFVLPTAPTRPVGLLGNKEVPAWFDCAQDASTPSGWRVNRAHLEASKEAYVALATQGGGTLETTVFAGFSQGGATALFTGLQTACAGILVMSSLLVATDLDGAALRVPKPVLVCVGDADQYVPLAQIEATKAFLADRTACAVQTRTFKGLGHTSNEQEAAVCANWLAKVLAVDDDDATLGSAAGVGFIK